METPPLLIAVTAVALAAAVALRWLVGRLERAVAGAHQRAGIDGESGLGTMPVALQQLELELSRARRDDRRVGVLSTTGGSHAPGMVGELLRRIHPRPNAVFRVGVNDYALVLTEIGDDPLGTLTRDLARELGISPDTFAIACTPQDGSTAAALLGNAMERMRAT